MFMMHLPLLAQVGNPVKTFGPKQGEWALSVGLNPIANYLGNLFNGKTDNKLDDLNGEPMAYQNESNNHVATLSGKYMFTDLIGLKVNVGVNVLYKTDRRYVQDQKAEMLDPFSQEKLTDSKRTKSNQGSLAIGVERRLTPNTKRLQAYAGGGLVWSFESENQHYSYGNAITSLNQKPANGFDNYESLGGFLPYARPIDTNTSLTLYHTIGVYGDLGVEYFITPAISVGVDMNVSALYTHRGQKKSAYEGYNVATQKVQDYIEVDTPAQGSFEFGTKNIGANLNMTFYF